MGTRAELSQLLNSIPGVRKAYFQPPASVQMVYPCIVYHVDGIPANSADNSTYKTEKQYQIIVVDPDPDSQIVEHVKWLPRTRFANFYTADNLNHWAFTITF